MKRKEFIIIILILFSIGCKLPDRPVCNNKIFQKPGGIFQEEWFCYYKWGVSYINGGCYEAAINDFNTAIKSKPEDKLWFRTYGMHFIDYFPNREIGIAYFFLGNFKLAKKYLTISIKQEPSERAKYYLKQVTKSIIKPKTFFLSVPELNIYYPANSKHCAYSSKENKIIQTKDRIIHISGLASDNQFIDKIFINNIPILIEELKQKLYFKHSLILNEGKHFIPVTVKNLLGGEKKIVLQFNIDRSGPVIIIKNWQKDKKITGALIDKTNCVSLKANGRDIKIQKGSNIPFEVLLTRLDKQIELIACDETGNETKFQINYKLFAQDSQQLLLVENNSNSSLNAINMFYASKNLQKIKPEISLFELKSNENVYKDNIQISGLIKGKSDLENIKLYILENKLNKWKLLYQQNIEHSRLVAFNQFVQLNVGHNKLMISTQDNNNNQSVKILNISRNISEVMKLKYRSVMKLFPYSNNNTTESFKHIFLSNFLNRLFEKKRFQIIFEQDNDLNINILKFSQQTKIPVNLCCEIKMIQYNNNEIEVSILLEDVNSTKILLAEIYDNFSGDNGKIINNKIDELIKKIMNKFPLKTLKLNTKKHSLYETNIFNQNFPIEIKLIAFNYTKSDPLRGSNSIIVSDAIIKEKLQNGLCLIKLIKPDSGQARWVIPK